MRGEEERIASNLRAKAQRETAATDSAGWTRARVGDGSAPRGGGGGTMKGFHARAAAAAAAETETEAPPEAEATAPAALVASCTRE